ncbi:hypothetical protein K469DRAFT_774795 [Zopfia rhizophila CBS 207.26]|uniref:Uncharacterized protein n=1 Tax=Zopfia rhizophila CBS 207.26 TaxID=1314779 RepID=A0A6A6EUG0_9PEZI|nr:hypothetical protein K469DRAFT_774795 [Zopfia rhizophila CBS 207.26]
MNNGTELDIQNWIPTYLTLKYKLDTSEKENHAIYFDDLYVILHAHWTMDWKPCPGRFWVEMLILLLSGATATRPGALVESASAKRSNKALSYEHITVMRVRDAKNPQPHYNRCLGGPYAH